MDKKIPFLIPLNSCFKIRVKLLGPCLAILSGLILASIFAQPFLQNYQAKRALAADKEQYAKNCKILKTTAKQLNLSSELLMAVVEAESSFDNNAISRTGAQGLMQIMPKTAKETAGRLKMKSYDLFDPSDNVLIGATYLKQMLKRYRSDVHLALAAYNAGPSNVDRWRKQSMGLPGPETVEQFAFDETRAYVNKVIKIAGLSSIMNESLMLQEHDIFEEEPISDQQHNSEDEPTGRLAYTVKKGDSLSGIAARFNVSLGDLIKLNNITNARFIKPGQILKLRPLGIKPNQTMSQNPVPDSVNIVVYKAERMLELIIDGKQVREYKIGLGWKPHGDKAREGDGKTPEGSFYVCQRLAKGNYGQSLGVSYPDAEDAGRGIREGIITHNQHDKIVNSIKNKKRPPWNTLLGGAICIHGRGSKRDWTAGCIALDDKDMNELFALTPMGASITIKEGKTSSWSIASK